VDPNPNQKRLLAIVEQADVEALQQLIDAAPSSATVCLPCGNSELPALHLVCDAVFRGLITDEQGEQLARILLDAGEDVDRAFARSGDTFLISAASLGAERVGLLLLSRGADPHPKGLFGATALHWAALMGCVDLVGALVDRGAGVELRDAKYSCTPLEWALHSWEEGTPGPRARLPDVVRRLRAAGAAVPQAAKERLQRPKDLELRAACGW